jgi:hypothetical protein
MLVGSRNHSKGLIRAFVGSSFTLRALKFPPNLRKLAELQEPSFMGLGSRGLGLPCGIMGLDSPPREHFIFNSLQVLQNSPLTLRKELSVVQEL